MCGVTLTHRLLAIAAATVVASCAGRPQVAPAPASPQVTVAEFLRAVNAADLGRMAELFGTERGPSTITSPNEPSVRRRQLEIMQRLLRNDGYQVVDSVESNPRTRVLQVELARGNQRVRVPFTLVAARTGGWLIVQIGIDQAMPNTRQGP